MFFLFFQCFREYLNFFDLKIVFSALQSLWVALLGLSELHFGSQEAPRELSGSSLVALSGSVGAHTLSASSLDRDFGALAPICRLPKLPFDISSTWKMYRAPIRHPIRHAARGRGPLRK